MQQFLTIFTFITLVATNAVFSQANSAVPDSITFVALPTPTGPFAVGRTVYDWIDSSRVETFSTDSKSRRELLVYVWYPASLESDKKASLYIPYFDRINKVVGEKEMRGQLGNAYEFIRTGELSTHTSDDAPIAESPRPFPVLVFSHGFGESGLTYTAMLEDLASHGYVIFAIEHPYDAYCVAFPDGPIVPFAQAKWDSATKAVNGAVVYQLAQIPIRAVDILFVLDQIYRLDATPASRFAGHLDLQQVGVFGHSLGGLAAARACQLDSRIRAGMNQDADYQGLPFIQYEHGATIRQPFMFFASDHSLYVSTHIPPPTDEQLRRWNMIRSAYDSLMSRRQRDQDESLATMPGGSYRVRVETNGFAHRSFIDTNLFSESNDPTAVRRNVQNLQIAISYTRAFFDKYLKHLRSTLLDEAPNDSMGVIVERFGPAGK